MMIGWLENSKELIYLTSSNSVLIGRHLNPSWQFSTCRMSSRSQR